MKKKVASKGRNTLVDKKKYESDLMGDTFWPVMRREEARLRMMICGFRGEDGGEEEEGGEGRAGNAIYEDG